MATASTRRIKLRRFAIRQAVHYYIHGFRLRIEVAAVEDMDPYVFMYRRPPADPYTGDTYDEFIGVASFPDLAEYPVGDPDLARANPFFRKDFIEVDVRSTSDYWNIWNKVVSEVCVLRNALDRADTLVIEEEIWCGDDTDKGESATSLSYSTQ